MHKQFFLLITSVFLTHYSYSQTQGVSISASPATPDPSAILDLSSTTQGTLLTRMTETERNAIVNPAMGLQIFNTTTGCFNFWTGTSWKQICGDCDFNSPIATNSGPVCEGSDLSLFATSISGATYQWSGPNGFTSNLQNPIVNDAGTVASGSYSVSATLNGCTSQLQSTVATVYSTPTTPVVSSNGPVCLGSALNLSSATINGATYNWAGPNGYSAIVQNPTVSNVDENYAGTYSVMATVNGCSSQSGSTNVAITPLPVSTFSFSPSLPLTNSSVGFTPTVSGLSYSWTFVNGTPGSSSTETPSASWSSAGTYSVSLTTTSDACSSTTTNSVTVSAPVVQTFLYTGGIVNWQVPSGVTSMQIEVWGAQGGSTSNYQGGLGAYAKGTFAVSPGDLLKVLVGGHGQNGSSGHGNSGGGGGGSFVSTVSNTPLIVAGGGGGAGTASSSALGIPDPGQTSNAGSSGKGNGMAGGTGGGAAPGLCGGCGATNGAGFYSNSSAYGSPYGLSALAFVNGGTGSASSNGFFGGFGGGGAGAFGAGGGGGYSGGGSGSYASADTNSGGGGGGSYNSGTDQTNTQGVQPVDGKVVFTY